MRKTREHIMMITLTFFLIACGPKLMRINPTKRDKFNFGSETSPFKSKKERSGKVIYSDRTDNKVYKNPYAIGKLPSEGILAPYFVVGKEGAYIEVVRYNPDQVGRPEKLFKSLKSPRYHFKEDEKVEYVGWIQKDNVLKYDHAIRNVDNGDFDLYVLGLSHVNDLLNLQEFLSEDCVHTFQEPHLKVRSKKDFKVNQVVYFYKYSLNKEAALVGSSNSINLKDTANLIMGWVPSTILVPAGQGQSYLNEKRREKFTLRNSGKETTILSRDVSSPLWFNLDLKEKTPLDQKGAISNTLLPISVWDHSNNRLISIKGTDITKEIVEQIREENKTLNFHLLMDCSRSLRNMETQMISSFQKIKLLAESKTTKDYTIKYSAIAFGCGTIQRQPLTSDFSKWVDFIFKVLNDGSERGVKEKRYFQDLLEMIFPEERLSFENNIVMVVGSESLYGFERNYDDFIDRLVKSSARIHFHQIENKPGRSYQDFILQGKQLLGDMSSAMSEHIKSFNVDYKLIQDEVSFTKLPSKHNLYLFDSPEKSSYQGGIAFPKINKSLTPGEFDTMIDSIVEQSLEFNRLCEQSRNSFLNSEFSFLRSVPSASLEQIFPDREFNSLIKNHLNETLYEHVTLSSNHEKIDGVPGYLLHRKDFEIVIEDYRNLLMNMVSALKKKDRKEHFKKYWKLAKAINRESAPSKSKLSKKSTIAELIFRKTDVSVYNRVYHTLILKDIKRKKRLPNKAYITLYKDQQSVLENLEELLAQPEYPWLSELHSGDFFFIPTSKTF
ncbi:MAG: type VI secretion system protein TssR domain-containing protein [Bacteroidota bacterium]